VSTVPTRSGDHPISETEVGGTPPGAIEHQQLLLNEDGLGHHGPGTAGPASRATVASRWKNRTATSRMTHRNKLAKPRKC
jgi:hypothetical protein